MRNYEKLVIEKYDQWPIKKLVILKVKFEGFSFKILELKI